MSVENPSQQWKFSTSCITSKSKVKMEPGVTESDCVESAEAAKTTPDNAAASNSKLCPSMKPDTVSSTHRASRPVTRTTTTTPTYDGPPASSASLIRVTHPGAVVFGAAGPLALNSLSADENALTRMEAASLPECSRLEEAATVETPILQHQPPSQLHRRSNSKYPNAKDMTQQPEEYSHIWMSLLEALESTRALDDIKATKNSKWKDLWIHLLDPVNGTWKDFQDGSETGSVASATKPENRAAVMYQKIMGRLWPIIQKQKLHLVAPTNGENDDTTKAYNCLVRLHSMIEQFLRKRKSIVGKGDCKNSASSSSEIGNGTKNLKLNSSMKEKSGNDDNDTDGPVDADELLGFTSCADPQPAQIVTTDRKRNLDESSIPIPTATSNEKSNTSPDQSKKPKPCPNVSPEPSEISSPAARTNSSNHSSTLEASLNYRQEQINHCRKLAEAVKKLIAELEQRHSVLTELRKELEQRKRDLFSAL